MGTLTIQLRPFFDWLLWVSLQGSVLIGLIVLLQFILRGKLGIRWHYLLWVLLLIRLTVPYLPESKISIFNLLPKSIQQGRIIEAFSEPQRTRGMDFYLYGRYADAQEIKQEGDSESFFIRFVRMMPFLWLLGAVVLVVYVCAGNFHLWWLVTRERPLTDQKILDLLEDCKSDMGIRTILGVVITDKVTSPALFGFVRPRLLLPAGMLEALSLKELRHVFLHELAHLKRHDIYLGYLSSLLQVLHWFNPLIWLAFYRIRNDRELACDYLVLSRTKSGQAKDYGQTIVYLLERFSRPRHLPAMAGILETKSQLKRRIKMITKFKKTSRPQWAGAMLLLVVLACVVLTNAYVAKADFIFSTPIKLGPAVNSSAADGDTSISDDGLELFFEGRRPDGYGKGDIYVSTRETTSEPWGQAVNLGPPVNGSEWDNTPDISSDGLTLYFTSTRSGNWDLWVTTRATKDDPWEEPVNLGQTVNSSAEDFAPSISGDSLSLYFASNRPGGLGLRDIWVTRRATVSEPWGEPVNLGPAVNSSHEEAMPDISADGLTLFFCDYMGGPHRPGGYGGQDIWVSTRASTNDPWGESVNLGTIVNSSSWEFSPNISADGSTFYFTSDRGGADILQVVDIWQVRILPVVDFNADGIVDSADVCMMVDHWHTDEPLYDIAPMPFGDGIVDVKDLVLLAEHLTKAVEDPNEPNLP